MKFSENEVDSIWRILSTICHLGNLKIDESTYEEQKTPAQIVQNEDFEKIVILLNCDRILL